MTEPSYDDAEPLIRIGCWLGPHEPAWPDAREFVDPDWDEDERSDMVLHLRQGTVARAYMGLSLCRFCGVTVGALEFTDGVYLWPQGLAHYVKEHDVRLPQRFVDHVRALVERFEQLPVDDSWWRGVTSWRGEAEGADGSGDLG